MYERSTPALVVRSHAGVAIQRGVAFAGFAGGKLVAIATKRRVLWEGRSVSQPRGNTELERISDITSNPVVDDEQVCAISFQGRVACFEPAQGSPIMESRDFQRQGHDAVAQISLPQRRKGVGPCSGQDQWQHVVEKAISCSCALPARPYAADNLSWWAIMKDTCTG